MSFETLAKILYEERVKTCGASELHGTICGVLVADFSFSFESWLDEMLHLDYLNPTLMQNHSMLELKKIFAKTAEQLRIGDLNFQMLLPQQDSSYQKRIIALSEWCSGFIYGFGIQSRVREADLSAQARTIFSQIAQIDSLRNLESGEIASTEDEATYREAKKFISMEVLLLSEEIQNGTTRKRQH